jgi:hypothetical protein
VHGTEPTPQRAPFQPPPIDIPWAAVPTTVDVTASDADQARVLFDRDVPDHAGLLDATPD